MMKRKQFKTWAEQHRYALMQRFQLEAEDEKTLRAYASIDNVELEETDRKPQIVQKLMGERFPVLPAGYGRRKVYRALRIPTVLKPFQLGKSVWKGTTRIRMPQ